MTRSGASTPRNPGLALAYIAKGAVVSDSAWSPKAREVYGTVHHSVIVRRRDRGGGRQAYVDSSCHARCGHSRAARESAGRLWRRTPWWARAALVGEADGSIAVVGQGVTLPAGVQREPPGQQVDETTFAEAKAE